MLKEVVKKPLNFFLVGKIQCLKQRMLFSAAACRTRIYSTDNSVLFLTFTILVRPYQKVPSCGALTYILKISKINFFYLNLKISISHNFLDFFWQLF